MKKITKTLTLALIILTLFSIIQIVCAAEITAASAKTDDIVVRAADNYNLGFDIKAYEADGENIYLFMPADVDISRLVISFGNVSKKLNMTSSKKIKLAEGEFTLTVMQTNLPVLNMNIDETQGTIEKMNSDPDHNTKCYGSFYLDVPTELAQKNGWEEYYTDAASEIRGRGNATWELEKKAYQIKLDKKQSILEMGKDKTWIILANHGDRSLIRNKLAYDFAKDMGLEFSLDSEFVDVYFNGEYQGNYLLTEKVELGKERVNIYDLEEKDENPDADRVTGGYLIEYDRLAQGEKTWTAGPNTGLFITIKSPEEADEQQKAYITSFINNMENAIYAKDGKSSEGKHYSEYMDVDSFIKLYWINEIFKNGDFFYGSTFMYKDAGADEKLYSGPAWDFDITLANACSNAGAGTPARKANLASPMGWWVRTVADGFTKYLFTHEDFRLRNKQIYDSIVKELLLNMPERAQGYAEYIQKSADMNFIRWDILEDEHQWDTPNKAVTYSGEVEFVSNYLTKRGEWIDRVMNSDMGITNLGTEQNPVIISTADDLRSFRDAVNNGDAFMGYYFRQTADINLNGEEFIPIGMSADGFMGNYDGGGYKIKNLKITTESVNDNTASAGLFAYVCGGEISNVHIESGVIDVVARDVGGIAGCMNGARIYNCTNKASVTNRADRNLQMVGGIVGHMVSGGQNRVINCINYGDVNAPNAMFSSCRGVGGVIGHASTGGVAAGIINYGKVSASFAPDGFVGGVIGELSGRRTSVTYAYWLSDNNPTVGGRGKQQRTEAESGMNMNTFSGTALSSDELGSESFVYEMNKQLYGMAQTVGIDYTLLKMWEASQGMVKLTDNFAHIDILPKFAPEWEMSDRSVISRWISSVKGSKAQIEDGFITLTPQTSKPIMSISLGLNEQFSADDYRYAAVKMRVSSVIECGAFFFETDEYSDSDAQKCFQFDVASHGRWHDYIIDMSACSQDTWHGIVNVLRLAPINGMDQGAKISVERIGLFKTEAQAREFLNRSDKLGQVLMDDKQTVYLSENAFLTKGKKRDFLMKNTDIDLKEKMHEKAQIVVEYIDNGGNQAILPICYTDDSLYTSYVANKPGTYKLTFGYKKYSDTANHWGEEYIDFVSARGLFGGTTPTEFSPEDTMTRAMFITVLGRMHSVEISQYEGKNSFFDDVDTAQYYAPYAQWAAENGIINTMTDKSFHPDAPIMRKDMAQIISAYINRYSYELQQVSDEINFSDIANLEAESQQSIQNIQRLGIINGKGENRFDPEGSSTRAEVSAVMARLIKAILRVL